MCEHHSMRRSLKIALAVVVGLVVLVAAGTAIYVWLQDSDPPLTQADVDERLDATTVPSDSTAGGESGGGSSAEGVDGTWVIGEGTEVGYRVDEVINGVDITANGRTTEVTGSITISGTSASAGEFVVDMASITSDESRRDGQFRGRIMATDQFPTATFTLTAPIDFGQIPDADTTITATATGDLTLRGTTRSVTFEVQATFRNDRIGILGQIPVVFADYGIPNPSFATITTEDNGLLEFILVLDRG